MPPRASLRAREATPARATRASSIATRQETPATRRSTRAASKQPFATKDVVSNPALPEIHTQQSYAYGSSKTPALPEQLHARSLNMSAVAAHLDDATYEAEQNLQAHAAGLRGSTPDSQLAAREERAQRRASRQPSENPVQSSPVETPVQVGKINRITAWVQTSSQLDDISEEPRSSTRHTEEREREESLPSSFPDGSFDHSYSYERAERGPRLPRAKGLQQPQPQPQAQSQPRPDPVPEVQPQPKPVTKRVLQRSTSTPLSSRVKSKAQNAFTTTRAFFQRMGNNTWLYLSRVLQMMQRSLLELPDTRAISVLFKTLITTALLSSLGLLFCLAFTRYCDSSSTSVVSQTLQSICGSCSNPSLLPTWNVTNSTDIQQLLTALKQIQNQISQVESRLNSRITSNHASLASDASILRSHQEDLETQIQQLGKNQPSPESSSSTHHEITSPLIPRINFFSPANGAIVIPRLTSPTLAQKFFFPVAVALRALRIQKLLSPPPITALENWVDEGDCWCAASQKSTNPNSSTNGDEKDSILLTIQTLTRIHPTELVIEHFPAKGSLNPAAAPKEIELWADFSSLTFEEWKTLHIHDLMDDSPGQEFIPGQEKGRRTWARIGTAQYQITMAEDSADETEIETEIEMIELDANEPYGGHKRAGKQTRKSQTQEETQNHVQRFNLNVNQNGLLHYSDRFMVRVRKNYGANFTCLYRVRLHGHAADSEGRGKKVE